MVGPERDMLRGRAAESHRGRKLAPRQFEPHRPAGPLRRHDRQRHVWPGAQRGPERAADERVDDADLIGRNTETPRDLVALVADPLGLAPKRQPPAVPLRHGRVRLHRVVLLAGMEVVTLDLHRGCGQRAFRIALPALRAAPLLLRRLGRRAREVGIEADAWRGIGRVGHADEPRPVLRQRLGARDHHRHRLAGISHLGVLQHAQLVTRYRIDRGPLLGHQVGEPVGVEMRQHQQNTGRALGGRCVDADNASGGYRAVGGRRIDETRWVELGGVARLARDLGQAIDATDRGADDGHANPPVSSRARAIVRRISSIL